MVSPSKVSNVNLWRFLRQYLDPADKQRGKLPVILDRITLTKVTGNIVRLPAIYRYSEYHNHIEHAHG